jgi:CheY-like chemotaxis protein
MHSKLCLIGDDESSIRSYVRAILEREQFQMMESENGVQALRLVEKLGGKLDVIVSDVQLPGGDGLTFIRLIPDDDNARAQQVERNDAGDERMPHAHGYRNALDKSTSFSTSDHDGISICLFVSPA